MLNYTKDHQAHQFVVSKTKRTENPEFGKLAEKEVYLYLLNHFDRDKWSGKFSILNEFSPTFELEIIWNNQSSESFLPYDISIRSRLFDIKIDVKATRGGEDNIFFVSIPELKKVLENPDLYIIARVSMIEEGKEIHGIRLNSEMNLNFLRFKNQTLELIRSNLSEWENYYGEKSIRFLTSHFEQNEPNELHPTLKFLEYKSSCQAIIRSFFQSIVNQEIEEFSTRTKELYSKTKEYSEITEDASLLMHFEISKKSVIEQLCNKYGADLRRLGYYEMQKIK